MKLLEEILSNKLMRKSTYMIKKNDLIDLSKLISKGYSLQESLTIIGKYEHILDELSKGQTMNQFISFKNKDTFYKTLSFFLKISSFDQAVLSAYEYDQFKKNLKNNWIKEISYPILLVSFTCAVYIFFDCFIYPQLQSLVSNQESIFLHQFLIVLFRILLLVIIILIIFIILYIFLIRKNDKYYHIFYESLKNISLFRKILSYDYAVHSFVLMKRGLSTKQVFESLLLLKNNQLLNVPLNKMIDLLQQGKEMIMIVENLSYFDNKFKHFYKIGYYSQNLENALDDYCKYQEEEFKKYLKQSSRFMTISAYIFVSIFIISIYQMLLVPLEMIQQF